MYSYLFLFINKLNPATMRAFNFKEIRPREIPFKNCITFIESKPAFALCAFVLVLFSHYPIALIGFYYIIRQNLKNVSLLSVKVMIN